MMTMGDGGGMPGFDGAAFTAVLVASEAMARGTEDAVRLAGGRTMTRIGWDDAAAEIGRQAGRPLLAVETRGIDPGVLEAVLPRIDSVATALDLNVVVMLDEAAIDVVAACLLGSHIQLLCDPPMSDLVVALAIAGRMGQGSALHSALREGASERLQRLNEEVVRIAEALVRLTDREPGIISRDEVGDRRRGFGAEPGRGSPETDAQTIRATIRARRLRDSFFPRGFFEDPAWDMLLDLFAAQLEGAAVSVSSLCIAAAVAPTTALRWIGKMTEAGLLERRPDPLDRRRAYMGLTRSASDGMRSYVDAIHRAGLTLT